MAHYPGNYT